MSADRPVSDRPVSDGSSAEQRLHPRHLVCVTTEVCPGAADKQVAIIRDMSVGGVYLLARAPMDAGERVTLSLHLSADAEKRAEETIGEVVRVDAFPVERAHVWSHGIAVRFEQPLVHLEKEIEMLAAALKHAGVGF